MVAQREEEIKKDLRGVKMIEVNSPQYRYTKFFTWRRQPEHKAVVLLTVAQEKEPLWCPCGIQVISGGVDSVLLRS